MRLALVTLGTVLVSLVASPGAAPAGEKFALGYTASSSYLAAMVAKDSGLFEKRGLDVDLQIIALNSAMPAALDAGTIQIAGTTSPVFLQAVDAGIGHSNPEVARAAETRHLALPADIVANMPIPRYRAPITDAMLQSWVDIMARQQMLSRKLDVSKLVVR